MAKSPQMTSNNGDGEFIPATDNGHGDTSRHCASSFMTKCLMQAVIVPTTAYVAMPLYRQLSTKIRQCSLRGARQQSKEQRARNGRYAPGYLYGSYAIITAWAETEHQDGICCHQVGSHLCEPTKVFVLPENTPGVWVMGGSVGSVDEDGYISFDSYPDGTSALYFIPSGATNCIPVSVPRYDHCNSLEWWNHPSFSLPKYLPYTTNTHSWTEVRITYFGGNGGCCGCPEHDPDSIKWEYSLEDISHNLDFRWWATNDIFYVKGNTPSVTNEDAYVELCFSPREVPEGYEAYITDETVRHKTTILSQAKYPLRLESITTMANSKRTIYNPAGVSLRGLAAYKVDIDPPGIIPPSDIKWHKVNYTETSGNKVNFYLNKNTGDEVIVRGVEPGLFGLGVTIDGFTSDEGV